MNVRSRTETMAVIPLRHLQDAVDVFGPIGADFIVEGDRVRIVFASLIITGWVASDITTFELEGT